MRGNKVPKTFLLKDFLSFLGHLGCFKAFLDHWPKWYIPVTCHGFQVNLWISILTHQAFKKSWNFAVLAIQILSHAPALSSVGYETRFDTFEEVFEKFDLEIWKRVETNVSLVIFDSKMDYFWTNPPLMSLFEPISLLSQIDFLDESPFRLAYHFSSSRDDGHMTVTVGWVGKDEGWILTKSA